ncbi:MAG: cation:proton antiporter [Dehalococcoidia bacterium]|nr:cation:proton antiporter [Dehalococcoidia bacterium]
MEIELGYIALLFGLLIVPKVLGRFKVPPPIIALSFGIACGMGLDVFIGDETINLLATFGIAALFLFAGLEVDGEMLLRNSRALIVHSAIGIAALVVVSFAAMVLLDVEWRASVLIGLALLTPSTGFILETMDSLGAAEEEKLWIKAKAISTEVIALSVLFVTLKSTSAVELTASGAALIAMVILLPLVFRFFSAHIAPLAPNSEYAFLLMVAIVCAYVTRELGVYYLVGAFLVGIAAQRFQHHMLDLSSERMFQAVQVFASFFVPFYFFHAGLEIPREAFGAEGILLGLAFITLAVPLRIGISLMHRHHVLGERWRRGMRVAVPLLPTLVFTLVLAAILRERFDISMTIFGGLIIYAIGTTLIPGFVFGQKPPECDIDVLSWERIAQRHP